MEDRCYNQYSRQSLTHVSWISSSLILVKIPLFEARSKEKFMNINVQSILIHRH